MNSNYQIDNFDRPPMSKEPRLSKRELCRLLKTDLLDVYIITQVLRGTSLNLYCVLLTSADQNWKCKFTQRQLLSLTAIANSQTLQKQERWLEDLKLIKKYQLPGDRTGSLYRVHSLNVLPLPEEITSQFGDYLLPYEQMFLRQEKQLIQAETDALNLPAPTDALESTAAPSSVVDHSIVSSTPPPATQTQHKVAKIHRENGKVYKRVEYEGPGDIKMYDYYEDDVPTLGGKYQPAPPDDECLETGPDWEIKESSSIEESAPEKQHSLANDLSEVRILPATQSHQTVNPRGPSNQILPLKIGAAENPFRLNRTELQQIALVQTGVRIRPSYSKILKTMKSLSQALTFEEILDDALSFYFEHSEEGRAAVKKTEIMYS